MQPAPSDQSRFRARILKHLTFLYPDCDATLLTGQVMAVFEGFERGQPAGRKAKFSESDCLLITYGDSVKQAGQPPLQTLMEFLQTYVSDTCTSVHILPFCPYSSDDGFSVTDYASVNPTLGSWEDVKAISQHYRLMADLVINHVSSQSEWFQNYCHGREPGASYFIEASVDDDLSSIVRPRASPLLRPTETPSGVRHVWCTFSHDQIDLNFRNPDVLLEFLRIIRLYLEQGVRLLRLDAVGFLWKQSGTTGMHLPETHEVVRLLRTIVDCNAPGTMLLTETNVPQHENLSYFGNRNEAHAIYNFSLPPLLVHSLLTGVTDYLKRWMMGMPPAPAGCFYLNFVASHDGIGMRPSEGLLSDDEQFQLVETIHRFGGRVSTRTSKDGTEKVYELNVSLFDALQGTTAGPDAWQIERFLCSQIVLLGLEGIPAIYIHSLLATCNDDAGLVRSGHSRAINRYKWDYPELQQRLADPDSPQSRVMSELLRLIRLRQRQPAFHPNATQFTLQLAEPFFAFWRQSRDRSQSVFAVHNMTAERQELRLSDLNLIAYEHWGDVISGTRIEGINSVIDVAPYQCLWITNRTKRSSHQ